MKTITKILILLFIIVANTSYAQESSDVRKKINSFIEKYFDGAIVIETEADANAYEVELIHRQKEKKVYFDSKGDWKKTTYDLNKSELPRKVTDALDISKYSSYSIDDIEFTNTPKQNLYKIDLSRLFADDVVVYIDSTGRFI